MPLELIKGDFCKRARRVEARQQSIGGRSSSDAQDFFGDWGEGEERIQERGKG